MNSRSTTKLMMTLLTGLFALAVCLCTSVPVQAQGPIHRLSANFKNFNITETLTAAPVPGIPAFSRTVMVPTIDNTLYVTMFLTADQHLGNGEFFSCNLDGVFCNPGMGGADGAPPGWITLGKHFNYDFVTYNGGKSGGNGGGGSGDMHDNAVSYQWCITVAPGSIHTVQIRLASSLDGGGMGNNNDVFFEAAHFFVDSSFTTNGCTATP
jgi:hypothetical protein